MATYKIKVNGITKTVEAEAEMPLLWALRDLMGLTGTKYGCGIGSCGSCTVMLNGESVRSCQTAISDVGDKDVLTIEGLGARELHPLQKAWVEHDVPQCGFCQAGQIMAAAAFLKETPNPTDAQIDEAMNAILCRCGTYPRIREAIKAAAKEMK
ncbi:MAG: (2Fe-2S)-binding protein [Methanoregulaceae archaeon]|nr:(2Fe-2S)-binding protein [Methanoregulaceae archaeon]